MPRHRVNWEEIPETTAPNGVGRRVLEGTAATLVMVRVPAGLVADRHSHPHEQFVQVVTGSGVLTTEEGDCAFRAGSIFHFPTGTWHEARFETDTCLVETNLGG
jgi:quercetin dioxygenase-like cupin family protein